MDAEGVLTFVSERVTEVLGFLPAQLVGSKLSDIGKFAGVDGKSTEPDWRSPFRDVPFTMQETTGRVRRLLLSGLPFYEPETWELEGFCGVADDITDVLDAEEHLRIARDAAEAASRAKTDFLSYMGHELRTPLTAIIGFSEHLQRRGANGEIDDRTVASIGYVLESGRHLLNLVEEVLDNTRSEKHAFQPVREELDVGSLVDVSLAMVSREAAKHDVSVVDDTGGEPLPKIVGDPRLTQRVLLNLLTNAISYIREQGSVRVYCTMPGHRLLAINVEDTGQGIAADQLEAAFEPFNRLGREAGAILGTGIGLALVKRMVEAMGGRITVVSEVDRGSTFSVELPTAK